MSCRKCSAAASLLVFTLGWARAESAEYGIAVSRKVMVPMRDGVRLSTDIYLPARNGTPAAGKFPAIVERTPYGAGKAEPWANYFVPKGYVAVAQDVRGRFGSQGRWFPLRDDVNDGYDLAQWIGRQPWSNGRIGTVGTSYAGGTQHAMAIGGAPHLAAMVPTDAMSNPGRYGVRHNGAFELRFFNWIFLFGNSPSGGYSPPGALFYPAPDPETRAVLASLGRQVVEYVKALPLRRGTSPLRLAPEYEDWLIEAMSHGDYDRFWKDCGVDVASHVAEYKDIPVYHVSGWYDSWGTPVANINYPLLAKAKKSPQRLIMGPWTHGGQTSSFAGEAEFGPTAAIDFNALRLRWFERWLKGVENGVEREAPVRIFVMGGGDAHKTAEGRVFVGGSWRDEREWPPARSKPTPFYLNAGGRLTESTPAAAPPTKYLFDPREPAPTIGGNVSSEGVLMPRGAMDQRCRKNLWSCKDERPLSARNDVLVFQTEPLAKPVEVTGRLIVKLWISSSAPDTDFTAKLIDVYPPNRDFPAGIDLNVADSIVRARYRESLEKAVMMTPGQVYPVTIEMYPTSLVFAKGHRIRLDISSSNFPRFDVNPNTGEPLNDNRGWSVAENAVYHDPGRPSHILLPIMPQ
ncbi:MAG: CocE/NonD family hydrolase [Bryobacteraceae bacterium]